MEKRYKLVFTDRFADECAVVNTVTGKTEAILRRLKTGGGWLRFVMNRRGEWIPAKEPFEFRDMHRVRAYYDRFNRP